MSITLIKRLFSLGVKALSIVATFLVAKLYISSTDVSQYGLYILNHGYLLTAGTLAGMGQGILMIKKLSSKPNIDLGLVVLGYFNVFLNFAVFVLIAVVVLLCFMPEYVTTRKIVAFFFYSISFFNFELIRLWSNGNMYILFKDILRTVLVMMILLVKPFTEVDSVLMITSIGMAVVSLGFLVYQLRGKETLFNPISKSSVYTDMKEGWSISLGSGLQVFKGWVEVFLAGAFLSEVMVGLYALLLRLGKLVSLPLVALNADIAKQLAVLADGGSYSRELKINIRITRYLGVLFGLGALMVSDWFIEFYEFRSDVFSLTVAGILIISNTANVLFGPVGFLAQLGSMRWFFNFATVLSIILVSLLTMLLVGHFNVISLAVSSLVAGLIWNIMLTKRMKRVVGFQF